MLTRAPKGEADVSAGREDGKRVRVTAVEAKICYACLIAGLGRGLCDFCDGRKEMPF